LDNRRIQSQKIHLFQLINSRELDILTAPFQPQGRAEMSPDFRTNIDTSRERNRSIDDLDRAFVSLAARINSATHDLLILIRRFDERAGWLRWGFENCADWLHWRCDISLKRRPREGARGACLEDPAGNRHGLRQRRSVLFQGTGADAGCQ
jgi:hypothetical protein